MPWQIWEARKAPNKGLVLYWFPASQVEVDKSSLRTSRILSLYAAQCVTMTVGDAKLPELQPIIGDSALPVAVLCIGHVDAFYPAPMLELTGWARARALDELVFHNQWQTAEPRE